MWSLLQIYSPPYLFKSDGSAASRPKIVSVSPAAAASGGTITVTTDSLLSKFSLIRLGTTTHTVNTDQRRIALTPASPVGLAYKLTLPSDPGILLPGYWMVFALNSNGVPSVAATIRITG